MSDLANILRGTADLIDAVSDAIREQRTGFSEREAGDYLDTAGIDGSCTCPNSQCPLEAEDICDEAEADEGLLSTMWADYFAEMRRRFRPEDSAAVSAAADPSPVTAPTVGDEGPGGASDIPQSAPPGQPTCAHGFYAGSFGPFDFRCVQCQDEAAAELIPVPPVVAGESPTPLEVFMERWYQIAADEAQPNSVRNAYRNCANELDNYLGGVEE
ncbi:hypothetical protein [Mycobacterium sp. DL440]|uniref:hypothetical protein n=1 Tax=Mycobacterium sp. DL440 TaxID=2675523 RepID=UPI00141E4330|nr:hypothetical protein [Mycobacterium sp. DL440]